MSRLVTKNVCYSTNEPVLSHNIRDPDQGFGWIWISFPDHKTRTIKANWMKNLILLCQIILALGAKYENAQNLYISNHFAMDINYLSPFDS
jgi:hypothetical protein